MAQFMCQAPKIICFIDSRIDLQMQDALSTGRLFSGGGAVEEDTLASSPAAPPVAFALNAAYYKGDSDLLLLREMQRDICNLAESLVVEGTVQCYLCYP